MKRFITNRNMKQKYRDAIILIYFFFALLLFFLLVQKPLFILYNSASAEVSLSIHDWLDIYKYGLFTDLAVVAYLMVLPLLIVSINIFHSKYSIFTKCLERRVLEVYFIFVALVVALAVTGDTCLYEFWKFKLDRSVFYYMTDPKNAVASVSVGFVVGRLMLWLILSALIYVSLIWPFYKFKQKETQHEKEKHLGGSVLLFVVGGIILFSLIRGWQTRPNTPERTFYSDIHFCNHAALNPCYSLIYSLSKDEIDVKAYTFFNQEEQQRCFDELFPHRANSTQMMLKTDRPNIVFVILEGFGSHFIEALGGKEKVAPNLSRLANEAICFDSCYCGSFSTDRGIICALSGYPGQPSTSIIRFTHKIRNLPSLPRSLKEIGYHTQVLYGGDITYFNISEYLLMAGHERLISDKNFSEEERMQKWGVPDHIAFEWLYQDIVKKQKENINPWYSTLLTLSSHHPFDVPNYERLQDLRDNAFAYTDSCFGAFIERLKRTKAWDNLLVVVTADHSYNIDGIETLDFPFIPCMFLGGAVKAPRHISFLMNQTDIAATILGQLGVSHDEYVFSRDVFGDTYTYPFAFNIFLDGYNFRDSTGCSVAGLTSQHIFYGADVQRESKAKVIVQEIYEDIVSR